MKVNQAKKKIEPFVEKCQADNDPFLIAHFSVESDQYRVYHEGLDFGDALLIIDGLKKHFKL